MVGVVVGAAALAVLFWLTRAVSMRLPLRPVFVFTSGFLFLMALRFIGQPFGMIQRPVPRDVTSITSVPELL